MRQFPFYLDFGCQFIPNFAMESHHAEAAGRGSDLYEFLAAAVANAMV